MHLYKIYIVYISINYLHFAKSNKNLKMIINVHMPNM